MISIENDQVICSFSAKGAQWQHLTTKSNGLEWLWQADPAFWAKSAPVLFPIVGALRHGWYAYQGVTYHLGRHGFARDLEFDLLEQSGRRLLFRLESSQETRQNFPFKWQFFIEYRLENSSLITSYQVENPDVQPLYFSLGAHPAFRVPLLAGEAFEDYVVEFDQSQQLTRWYLNEAGLVTSRQQTLPLEGNCLRLSRALLADDALVFKDLQSSHVTLFNPTRSHRLRMDFAGFPFFGIWSAPKAPFLCLEPWCGLADSDHADGQLETKPGIIRLPGGERFERQFTVTVTY